MFNVIGINKRTEQEIMILPNVTEEEAERTCEEWGWIYDDGHKAYWMSIREGEK